MILFLQTFEWTERYLRNKVGYQFVGWGKCFFEESEYNGIEFILQRWESFEELARIHTFP